MNRRLFFRNIAWSAAGFYLIPAFTATGENSSGPEPVDMDKFFPDPPDSFGPLVMWFWMDGHVSEEGISLDLEMMKRTGFRGAYCFGMDSGIPAGPVKPGSDVWLKLLKHTNAEANRLGLEMIFQIPRGFSDDHGSIIPQEFRSQQLVWSEITIPVGRKVHIKLPHPAQKSDYYRDIYVIAFPVPEADEQLTVDPGSVIDLTSFVNKKGVLKWETRVTGNWTIQRIGHCPAKGQAEIDFLRKEAIDWMFTQLSSVLSQNLTGDSCKGFFRWNGHTDPHLWSAGIDLAFSDRFKYSLKPWLPALTGKVTGSPLKNERFLVDFARFQLELYAENLDKSWMNWCVQKGLKWYSVSSAFLNPETQSKDGSGMLVDSNGVNGRNEPMAILADSSRLDDSAGGLKIGSDHLFSLGFSELVISPFVHEPYKTCLPGMVSSSCGIGYGRSNTLQEGFRGLTKYLRRTQYLLSQGTPVADICIFRGDLSPDDSTRVYPFLPAEYPYIHIDRDTLAGSRMENGKILLPDGSVIHTCLLHPAATLYPQTLKLLTELVENGMVLVLQQKPSIYVGLADSEEETAGISRRLFGDLDGQTNRKHDAGKGKVYLGVEMYEILDQLSVPADFTYSSGNREAAIRFSHRKAGDSHMYSILNLGNRTEKINCSFRISHLKPEIWSCETGEIIPAPIFSVKSGRLRMPLEIQAESSVFILFRKKFGISSFKKITKDGKILMDNEPMKFKGSARFAVTPGLTSVDVWDTDPGLPLSIHPHSDGSIKALFQQNGVYNFQVFNESVEENLTAYVENCFTVPLDSSWTIQFPVGSGAPPEITPDKLESLSVHPDFNIRHFSGTCTYKTVFYLTDSDFISGRKFLLDLGEVGSMARVTMNGKDAGLLWKKPFLADISEWVSKGENILKVDVTNSLQNRMKGDESLPAENEYNQDGAIVKLPDWYTGNLAKPGERKTFTVRKCVSEDDLLQTAGLQGPVKIIFCEERFL
jgi:hypothetical protein